MMSDRCSSSRAHQQGGLTIIMALVLVAVMGAATFSLSRNAIRELSMAGTIIQGNKAAAAADAGLDWVVIWGQGGIKLADFTAASPSTKETSLLNGIKNALFSTTGSPVVTITAANDASMTLNQGGAANTRQDFDIELRWLGGKLVGPSTDNSPASGDTGPSVPKDSVWRLLATGRATPKNAQTYQAQRELVATMPPISN